MDKEDEWQNQYDKKIPCIQAFLSLSAYLLDIFLSGLIFCSQDIILNHENIVSITFYTNWLD